jgi:hypothetical protein
LGDQSVWLRDFTFSSCSSCSTAFSTSSHCSSWLLTWFPRSATTITQGIMEEVSLSVIA